MTAVRRRVAFSVSYNPTPSTPLRFAAKVAPPWVGQATRVAEALRGTPASRFLHLGECGRDYRVGYRLSVLNTSSLRFELGVDA